MRQFVKRHVRILSLALSISGCQGMQLHDWKAGVTLPYSENCFFVHVLSGQEEEIPATQCADLKARSLIMTSEDWKILREDIQSSCQMAQCKQIVGRFDNLFLTIDQALQKLP